MANYASSITACWRDYSRYQRPLADADAMGLDPEVVEKVAQGTPGDVQCQSRDGR